MADVTIDDQTATTTMSPQDEVMIDRSAVNYKMAASILNRNDWLSTGVYEIGDLARDQGIVWVSNTAANTNLQPSANQDKWDIAYARTLKQAVSASGAVTFGYAHYKNEVTLTGTIAISALPVPNFIGQEIEFVGTGSGEGTIATGNGVYSEGVTFTSLRGIKFTSVQKSSVLVWEMVVNRVQECSAWATFQTEVATTLQGSFNISSITDLGVGITRLTFLNPMPDTNYCVVGSSGGSSGNDQYVSFLSPLSTTHVDVYVRNTVAVLTDTALANILVFSL